MPLPLSPSLSQLEKLFPYAPPTQISSEVFSNIRTIAGLAKEKLFVELYEQKLERPYRTAKKRACVYGICYSFARCVIFMAYAASFTYGSYLISTENLSYTFVFRLVPVYIL